MTRTVLWLLPWSLVAASAFAAVAVGGHTPPKVTVERAPVNVVVEAPVLAEPAPRNVPGATGAVAGVPVRLAIPTLRVDAPVVPVGVSDGALQVPDDIATVGVARSTVLPGSPTGTTLIAGHRDAAGGRAGALNHLDDLHRGDTVRVRLSTGASLVYRVTNVREYPKEALPQSLGDTAGAHRLALITCGGPLQPGADGRLHYSRNVVVIAVPTPNRAQKEES